MARRIVAYIAWALAALACLIAFFWTGSALALAILVVVVAFPLVGWLATRWASSKVQVALEVPTSAQKGAPISCVAAINNPTPVPVLRLDNNLNVRNLLTGQQGRQCIRASVPARSAVQVPFEMASDLCGRVECVLRSVSCFEPFSLFSTTRTVDDTRRLSVMPNLHQAHLGSIMAASPLSDTVQYSPYTKGQDLSEVFGLREYEQGDDLRAIHWKLSEKIDRTVVREPSLPIDNSLLVFWDKGLYGHAAEPELGDTLAEVMLGLCQALSSAGLSFEVAFNDVGSGRCVRERIDTEDDIYELVGHLMSSPLGPVAESGLAAYVRLFGPLACSRLIYVGAALPDDLKNLAAGKSILAFLCDGGSDIVVDAEATTIHFGVGQAAHALEMAGVM